MRHQVRGRALGRTSAHKKALRRNLLAALFTHERIVTTVAKAKEFRPAAERMITLAKKGGLHHRQIALSELPDKAVIRKLFDDIAKRFAARKGGYTRVLKLGRHRLGDNAPRAIFELVERKARETAAPEVGIEKSAAPAAESAGEGKVAPKGAKKPAKKPKAAAE
ncbi:MAG: 50S ribosomal protein L17 [Planctomycetes bacterium]|nr:50S ribosomal protein L17 [Planctomycetota bacterium]